MLLSAPDMIRSQGLDIFERSTSNLRNVQKGRWSKPASRWGQAPSRPLRWASVTQKCRSSTTSGIGEVKLSSRRESSVPRLAVECARLDHLPDTSWGVVAVDGFQVGLVDDLRIQDRLWLVVPLPVLLGRQLAV